MKNKSNSIFLGLKPYKEEDSDYFFGREQDKENLLTILQKNKFLTLTGGLGSGKSSLLKAGLIPRLKNGFVGQTGKDWSIAYFRPGISPLNNLAHALTFDDVLNVESKPNTTDYKNYLDTIKNSGSMGLVEIYKNSEIYNKRNLLVVIDQLEDLFKFSKQFDVNASDDDHLLMNLVHRSVSIKNSAVYFIICIQTPFLTKLTSYTKLQEIISQSQYAIQNIDSEGINEIIANSFYKHQIAFSFESMEYFKETINNEPSYLPNFQYLLKRMFEVYVIDGKSEGKILDIDEIKSYGGIENVISMDLERIYKSNSNESQVQLSRFFQTLVDYESLSNISKYMDASNSEVSKIISNLKKEFNDLFDVFKPIISGVNSLNKNVIGAKSIITLKYGRFINWERRNRWLKEENDSYEKFKLFLNDAIRKSNGEGGFLKTPALETAIAWRDHKNHDVNWASKYPLNFNETLKYINESEQDDLRIKKAKEDQLRLEKKADKTKKTWYAIGGMMCLIFGMFASGFWLSASKSEKIAMVASKEALIQKEKAFESAAEALENEEEARKNAIIAQKNELKAVKNAQIASKQRKKANEALEKLKYQMYKDSLTQIELDKQTKEAKKNAEIALEESDKNIALKEMIEIKTYFFRDLDLELSEASQEKEKENIKRIIAKSMVLEDKFDSLRLAHKSTNISNVELMAFNQKTLSVLEEKDSYSKTKMRLAKTDKYSIRDFDIFDNKEIVFAGDDGKIYFYDIFNTKTQREAITAFDDINDRIRKVKFINRDELLLGTFSGRFIYYNAIENSIKDLIEKSDAKIIDFYVDKNIQHLVLENKIVTFKNKVQISENNNFKKIFAAFHKDQKLFVVTGNGIYLIDEKGNSNRISIEASDAINPIIYEKISEIYLSDRYLFIGMDTGLVHLYDYNLEQVRNITPLKSNIEPLKFHLSMVTSIYFDEDNDVLYTSSLDNKIFRFDISTRDNDLIRSNYSELIGHEKWIWNMGTFSTKEGIKLLVTGDENGNLLTWFTDPQDLRDEILRLFNVY